MTQGSATCPSQPVPDDAVASFDLKSDDWTSSDGDDGRQVTPP